MKQMQFVQRVSELINWIEIWLKNQTTKFSRDEARDNEKFRFECPKCGLPRGGGGGGGNHGCGTSLV